MTVNEQSQLMSQAVDEACRHTRELVLVCSSIGDRFSLGREQEGVELLRFLLSGLGCISQAVHLTSPLQEERGIRISLEELPGILTPLVEALENKDYALVGDLVTCEIEPILSGWSLRLDELNRKRPSDAGKSG
jgi:hypothetical protein